VSPCSHNLRRGGRLKGTKYNGIAPKEMNEGRGTKALRLPQINMGEMRLQLRLLFLAHGCMGNQDGRN